MSLNDRHHGLLLRVPLGCVFVWFGVLKFFPGLSSAEHLVTKTINVLSGGMLPTRVGIMMLALWECLIGIGFFSGRYMKFTLMLFYAQMLGTFMPLFLFPDETFLHVPYSASLEGQYIIKNLVLLGAGMSLWSGMPTNQASFADGLKDHGPAK